MTVQAKTPPVDLGGQRVLITQAGEFMGPTLCAVFGECGAEVIADQDPLTDAAAPAAVIARAGQVDTLIVNLAYPAPRTSADAITDDEWRSVFAALVDPLPRLVRAVLPQMSARGKGRILVMGSAAPMRGMPRTGSYTAARGAQLGYVQAVGVELASKGVRVNAIAQNFVENPTYYPPEVAQNPKFQARLAREVPLGRLVTDREDALFAAMLCAPGIDCFVGQAFPVSGGWAVR
ncbi:MAG: SDR family oxidoreductase [Burkholderiaceae bacterium]|nr:SDR family oxidoreductase [Burkholderiaceae bacterium]